MGRENGCHVLIEKMGCGVGGGSLWGTFSNAMAYTAIGHRDANRKERNEVDAAPYSWFGFAVPLRGRCEIGPVAAVVGNS